MMGKRFVIHGYAFGKQIKGAIVNAAESAQVVAAVMAICRPFFIIPPLNASFGSPPGPSNPARLLANLVVEPRGRPSSGAGGLSLWQLIQLCECYMASSRIGRSI